MVWRIIGSIVGLALLIVGIPLTLSPIPLGLLVVFIAVLILVASNPLAARFLRWLRRKNPAINRFFRKAEDVLPDEIAGPLHDTDNGDDEDDDHQPKKHTMGEPMRRIDIPRRYR